jgi:hypothetical protein
MAKARQCQVAWSGTCRIDQISKRSVDGDGQPAVTPENKWAT